MATSLASLLDELVPGPEPGVVALVHSGAATEVATAGVSTLGGSGMHPDTIVRLASVTKPILAAASLALADRGRFALADPIARWLPELESPPVLRTPTGDLDDVVALERPITIRHLLAFQGGHGFLSDADAPVVRALVDRLRQGPPGLHLPPPDQWLATLATIPLAHQPGAGWTYNTGADILGVLLARAERATLGEVLADTLFDPLGMTDTGFVVPGDSVDRFCSSYRRGPDGQPTLLDPPTGAWSRPPAFPSGSGGLVSTAGDLLAFGRMLLAGGEHAGRRVLSPESVEAMTTPQSVAEPGNPFLDGQAWGYGGSVDTTAVHPWNLPGRYGWVGGSGTAFHVLPSAGTVTIYLSQRELRGPDDVAPLARFFQFVADQRGRST